MREKDNNKEISQSLLEIIAIQQDMLETATKINKLLLELNKTLTQPKKSEGISKEELIETLFTEQEK